MIEQYIAQYGFIPVIAAAIALAGLLVVTFSKTNVNRQRGLGLLLTANFVMSISCFVHIVRFCLHTS